MADLGHAHTDLIDAPYDVFKFKIQCLLAIGGTAVLGGLLPLKLRVRDRLLSWGNTLSGGVFLAAGFTHMLSEAVEGFEKLDIHQSIGSFPLPYVLCMLGILLTFFVEKVMFSAHSHHSFIATANASDSKDKEEDSHDHHHVNIASGEKDKEIKDPMHQGNWNMYVLCLLLSVHSLIEGAALGIEDNIPDATNVFIAIFGHKAFAAFAFGVNVVKHKTPTDQLIKLVLLFSSMTPIGILMGLTALQNTSNSALSETIKAVSSGTFIYIALVEVILEEFENPKDKYIKFLLLLAGASIMCFLSTGHAH